MRRLIAELRVDRSKICFDDGEGIEVQIQNSISNSNFHYGIRPRTHAA